MPGQFVCACLEIFENGRLAGRFESQARGGGFSASEDHPHVRIDPSHFDTEPDGRIHLQMRGTRRGGDTVTANLAFEPMLRHSPMRCEVLSRDITGGDHFWVVPAPLCRVDGEVHFFESGRAIARVMRIVGRGMHDHRYGSRWPGSGVSRMIRGRILRDDRVVIFQHITPTASFRPLETVAIFADRSHVESPRIAAVLRGESHTASLLAYPRSIALGELRIENPRVIHSGFASARIEYDCGDAAALCEVIHPQRLRVPIANHLLERNVQHAR
jgi:hypothetical protein